MHKRLDTDPTQDGTERDLLISKPTSAPRKFAGPIAPPDEDLASGLGTSPWKAPYDRYASALLDTEIPWDFVRPWVDYMQHRRLRYGALYDAITYSDIGLTPTRAIDYHASEIHPAYARPFNRRDWRGSDARALILALRRLGIRDDWLAHIDQWLEIGAPPERVIRYLHANVSIGEAAELEHRRRADGATAAHEIDAGLDLIIALSHPAEVQDH